MAMEDLKEQITKHVGRTAKAEERIDIAKDTRLRNKRPMLPSVATDESHISMQGPTQLVKVQQYKGLPNPTEQQKPGHNCFYERPDIEGKL